MRILAHIHTMNDRDVLEQLLQALQHQSRRPDAILIVDNASVDGTLDRTFPENVTIIRNLRNLGTSGTVRTGFAHAMEHGFDWVWIFDADSVPEPDALEKLLGFFENLPSAQQKKVCFLAGVPLSASGKVKEPPLNLERGRMRILPLASDANFTRCDCTLWSGSLFRVPAVVRIGLPSADYMLDVAEVEYGYRARQLGLISYVVHSAVIHHDVGRRPGVAEQIYRLGPISLRFVELAPPRCYYSVRNMLYFSLYQYKPRGIGPALRGIVRSFALTSNFAIRPMSHRRHLLACMRGIWDGVTSHMERRY